MTDKQTINYVQSQLDSKKDLLSICIRTHKMLKAINSKQEKLKSYEEKILKFQAQIDALEDIIRYKNI